ncbi:MAG: metallophosphoesterase [Clostridia bacterium]|nr:metallophosphoesterase [Clostridia bacterium]
MSKEKKTLRFGENGRFRVLMISDFHGRPDFNPKLTAGIEALMKYEKPDFVMLGGDQLCGTTKDELRAFLSACLEPVMSRGIPWAHVFGNHDDEQPMSKEEQEEVYESFDLCLSQAGPSDLSGVGNYRLEVLEHGGDRPMYDLYALDSHGEIRDYVKYFGLPDDTRFVLPDHFGAGCNQASPMFDQVDWYFNMSKRRERELGYKVPALMFMHVPIIECQLASRNPEETGFIGHKRESVGSGELNSGVFMAALQRGDVKGMFFGHDHYNVFQAEYCGISLGVGSPMGYNMSAHDDLRGGRVIDIYEDGRMFQRSVRLLDIMGSAAVRDPSFFEGGDRYYIRIRE